MPNVSSQVISLNCASPKFLPKKERALLSLLQGANVTQAAAEAGVHERTIRRWLTDPEFQKRLSKARDEMYTETLDSVRGVSSKAAKTLIKLLDSRSEKIALKAAELILNFGLKINTEQERERRIEELEKIVDGIAEGGRYEEFEEARREIRKNFKAR